MGRAPGEASLVLPHIRQNRISVGNEVAIEFGFVLGVVVFQSQIISDEEGWLDAVGKVGTVPRLLWDWAMCPSVLRFLSVKREGCLGFLYPSAGWTMHNSKDLIHTTIGRPACCAVDDLHNCTGCP